MVQALLQSDLPFPVRRGKVRDVYDLGDQLLIVATDRISAFDCVMPNGIPDKGKILTALSFFWFEKFARQFEHHLISEQPTRHRPDLRSFETQIKDRSMLVKKATVVPIECVARGYLAGSGWKEYQQSRTICGIELPAGLQQCDQLPHPIFTPATKEESGHDINISYERMCDIVGRDTAQRLRTLSLEIYRRGADFARQKGIIIADTKFEFGSIDGQLILIDEVLTPDSSRFWPMAEFEPGHGQPSFDKQFVRDWLETTGWDKNSPPPALPADIVEKTRAKYVEGYTRLVGEAFPWQ